MSAEILREAAALMRERAEAVPPGPWEKEFSDVIRTDWPFGAVGYLIAESSTVERAEHIASWHPAVVLAVADMLDHTARVMEEIELARQVDKGVHRLPAPRANAALNVARAYLGRTA